MLSHDLQGLALRLLSGEPMSLDERRAIGREANRLVEDARALEGFTRASAADPAPPPDNVVPIRREGDG